MTEEMRNEIRRLHEENGLSYESLSEQFGVSSRTISRICNQEQYEVEKRRNDVYAKQNMTEILSRRKVTQREFHLRLAYSKDGDLIEYLTAKDNVNGYLRSLVRKDMEARSESTATHYEKPD